ncbi:hypothetical protein BDN72DRAFT_534027 [Pluteus cervinus]|uniref:Uncharacterized protein n=1 Tax=Pluteus cervinus TaxID=181527 RepID=A0ACD3AYI3_9AGAR|nr:hypothetical protein BDN72DRAFT_534027 [Pluteus cervinus]
MCPPPMLLIPYCAEQLTLGGSCSVRKYLFPGLVSFITHLTIQMGTFDFNENETITLPNVHTLVIDTEGFGRMDHLHSFCQHIDLPCLRNLEFSARVPNFLNACIALCERHSRKIKSLRIGPDPYYNPRGLSVSRKPTIEACSSLVDLSIDFFTEHASHPTLTRLDIIYPFPAEDETTFPLELPMKWDFPSVQQIRVISLDLSRLQGLQDNLPWTIDGDRVLLYDICVCRIKVGKNDALLVHPKVEHDLAQTELRWRSRHGDGDGGVIDENAPADGTAAGDNMATLEGEDRPEASRDSSDSSSDFTWSPGSSDDSESDSEEEAEIDYEELRGEFDWSLDRQEMLEIFHEISGREYGDIYLPSDHAHDRGEDELEDHTSDVEVRQSVYIR